MIILSGGQISQIEIVILTRVFRNLLGERVERFE